LGTGFVVASYPLYSLLARSSGAAGLALAGSLAITLNAAATVALGRRLHGAPRLLPLLGTLVRALVASVPSAGIAWLVADIVGARGGRGVTPRALLELALALPLLYALGDEPTREVLSRVTRRLRRRRASAS
jgi:putative peptidoglycan lipid II flippase